MELRPRKIRIFVSTTNSDAISTRTTMCFINQPAANQLVFFCTFVIPALSQLPLLALLILVMKRRRPSPTPIDLEARGSPAWDDSHDVPASEKGSRSMATSTKEVPSLAAKVSHRQSPPRKRQRKAIPKRMRHMKNNMTVWGDRWLPAIKPSTAGSQQGELDVNGTYTASRSPPPAYRTTPLPFSPVVVESTCSSSPSHSLSSDFNLFHDSTSLPLSQGLSKDDTTFLFGDPYSADWIEGGESFGQLSDPFAESSSDIFQDDYSIFDFDAEVPSSLPHNPHPMTISSVHRPSVTPSPFADPVALMDPHAGSHILSDAQTTSGAYPNHGSLSDWISPPTTLPVNNVAHFAEGFAYNPPLSFSSPSQNALDFPTTAWTAGNMGQGQSIPLVGGYSTSQTSMSTSPMYSGYHSPYIAPNNCSPVYHASGTVPPLAVYSGQSHQYLPASHLPPSPAITSTGSSGFVASLFSMNDHSPHFISSDMIPCTISGSDYGEFEYTPQSGPFAGSPSSAISSAYGGMKMSYPNASRTVALPLNPPPSHGNPRWLL
ncbi:hypothetical protein MVEN_01195100 [Mycena venus]|uniref:Uncharacterized protein n=1 Tax=Mycena venus TaxID=2733690 RepID=A0A8H7CVR6_9AGAR|nr:hypothetical protein MVEN_01195100 [Mycena venus]